jgi:hypothetical protein
MSDLDTAADRPWTIEAVRELIALARGGVPAAVISLKLKRSVTSVRSKLLELGLATPMAP